MNNELVKVSKTLFATYAGLTASGYDMADCTDGKVGMIIESIRKTVWPKEVIEYFAEARTGRCEVNPYWPKASMLSTASLRLREEDLAFYNADALVEFFRSLDNLMPDEKGNEVMEWIMKLPDVLVHVVNHPESGTLWSNYKGIVVDRSERCADILVSARQLLVSTLGINDGDIPEFVFIPNLLQASVNADYEIDDRSIGVIGVDLNTLSVIHEALHVIFKPYMNSIQKGLRRVPLCRLADIGKMKLMGYAWNGEEESLSNISDESFVRAAALWVAYKNDTAEADKIAESYADDGFTIVPVLLQSFRSKWRGLENIEEVLDSACYMTEDTAETIAPRLKSL